MFSWKHSSFRIVAFFQWTDFQFDEQKRGHGEIKVFFYPGPCKTLEPRVVPWPRGRYYGFFPFCLSHITAKYIYAPFAVAFRPHALHGSWLRLRSGVEVTFNAKRANNYIFNLRGGGGTTAPPPFGYVPGVKWCLKKSSPRSRHVGARCFLHPTEFRLKITRVACRWIYNVERTMLFAFLTMVFFHRWDLLLNITYYYSCDVQNLKINAVQFFVFFSFSFFFLHS